MSIGFRNGKIRLDDTAGVYYSGQIISGCIVFELEQALTFSVLSVSYHGEAEVLWTETETEVVNDMEREYTVNYTGHEIYFNYTENLIGGAGTSQLPFGSHAIPFKYRIPSLSPSSFKGSKGQVHYKVVALMTYLDPSSSRDELRKEFEVVAPFDLNVGDPSIKQPINMEFEEVYGCMCACGARPVSVRVRLPAAGYCPGQDIPVDVDVQNDSNLEITKMKFEIVTKEYYRSTQPASEFILPETVVATAKKGAVLGNSSCSFTCLLRVPDMLAPCLHHCTLIDVMYFFRITIKVSGCNEEMQDESEIYIGLVPIKEITEGEYIHPMADNLPNSPIPVLSNLPAVSPGHIRPEMAIVNQFSPLQSAPYPNYGTPYPTNNSPYPINNPSHPINNPSHPINNPSHPTNNTSHPTNNTSYPTNNTSYPSNNPSHPTNNPSYPTNNPPYPSESKVEIQSSQKKPFRDYEIGFKAPESVSIPPYADMNPMAKPNPPYPSDNLMPNAVPPYPTDNLMPQVNPPYPNGSFTPSAPPP